VLALIESLESVFLLSPAYDCIGIKLVPIINNDVMAVIIKMFFVLFIVEITTFFGIIEVGLLIPDILLEFVYLKK
jgi:hypothetical protein